MITGELKNRIDSLWEIFWTGGLTNPLDVIEQMTYLMFIRDLMMQTMSMQKRRQCLVFHIRVYLPEKYRMQKQLLLLWLISISMNAANDSYLTITI